MNLLDKARKLLNLSQRGGTPAEAETAAAKLQDLLLSHNLEMQDIKEEVVYENETIELARHRYDKVWQRALYKVLADGHQCECLYLPRRNAVTLIGRKHNIEMVNLLFQHLKPMVATYGEYHALNGPSHARTRIRKSYRLGMIKGISDRLEQQLKHYAQQEGLLVLPEKEGIDARVKEMFGTVKKQRSQRTHIQGEAYMQGYQQGLQTPINQEVAS